MPEGRKGIVIRIPRTGSGRASVVALVAFVAAGAACGERAPETSLPADTARWSIEITEAASTVSVPPLPVLTGLRHETYADRVRVTFEIAGAPGSSGGSAAGSGGSTARPGYHLEYVDRPLIACGSGERIFPVGDAWLRVRLEPAAAHTEQGAPTLGPAEIAVDGALLQRIYRTCDFEGIVTYVLALSAPNPYRVFTLSDPVRIVVDVER